MASTQVSQRNDRKPGVWLRFTRALAVCLILSGAFPSVGQVVAADATNKPLAIVAFDLRRGKIMVPVQAGDAKPMSFLLDTGFSMTMIHPQRAKELQLRRVGEDTIVGIAGEEKADVYSGLKLNLNGAEFSPRRVDSLPSDANRRRDGILGSGFFRRYVVELDLQTKQIRLFDPKTFVYAGAGEILPLKFESTTPTVECCVNTAGQPVVKARFEVDTGCDGGLCLGRDFVAAHPWIKPESADRASSRVGVGGGVRTTLGHVEQFQLGRLTVDKPMTNFFENGSPVDDGLAGHIGLGVLGRFTVIFDYPHGRMILQPRGTPPAKSAL